MLAAAPAPSEPISVYTGPTRTGPALIAAVAADADNQTTTRRHGRTSHLAAGKHAHEPKSEAKSEAKSDAKSEQKPAPVRHANAATKPADKSATDPSTKQAKPKAAAKPPAKPAPKTSSGETRPAG
jgi:D-alanyl-D-alanine carboxypeptidase